MEFHSGLACITSYNPNIRLLYIVYLFYIRLSIPILNKFLLFFCTLYIIALQKKDHYESVRILYINSYLLYLFF